MAKQGPQKAILRENLLPPFTIFPDGSAGYEVKYRIVSEDRNRFSAYSPIFKVIPNYEYQRPPGTVIGDVEVATGGPFVNIFWDPITIVDKVSKVRIKDAGEYDVFLQWGKGETSPAPVWVYNGFVTDHADGFRYPNQYELTDGTVLTNKPNRLSVEVYLRSSSPSRDNSSILVYKIDNQTV